MPDRPRCYVDSCVYLAYVNEEADKMIDIDALFAEAQRGEIEMWTSVVTIAEVAFAKAEQDGAAPDPATLAKIDSLWTPPAPTRIVEFYDLIAEDARDIIRLALPDGRKSLKPMDAIHVATARRWDIPTVYTYDENMIAWGATLNLDIRHPIPLRPVLGLTTQLPASVPPLPAGQSQIDAPG